MITFDPLWETLKKKGISEAALRGKTGLSVSVMIHLKKDRPVSLRTIDILCQTLECLPEDILRHVENL